MIVQELFTLENILLMILSSIGSNILLKDITLELNNTQLLTLIIVHILLFNYLEIKLSHKCNPVNKETYKISALSINVILVIYIFTVISLIYVWIKYISVIEIIKSNPYYEYIPIIYFILIQIIYYLFINKLIFNFKC